LGLSLIASGVLALVVSIWQYWRTVHYLWSGSFAAIAGMTTERVAKEGKRSPVIAIAILLVCIGLFAFFTVLLRFV
jgi:putative membrane protein